MRPLFDPTATRACALLGALGVTCTLTAQVRGAPAKPRVPDQFAPAALAVMREVHWLPSGSASAPRLFAARPRSDGAARTVLRMIRAGNRIAKLPYTWGGGHGSFDAAGYDCSGSVSYVLHAGGLLSTPEDSGGLQGFGLPGPGRHVTIYANFQHAWMAIDGRRFDTIAFQETGTRWSSKLGSVAGYTVRHPAGL